MANPNAHPGTPDADDWTPSYVSEDRQARDAEGKWTVRRRLDDDGPGTSEADCCGRRDVDHMEMVRVTGPLRAALQKVAQDVPGALAAMNLDPDADYLCGDCLGKLHGRWRVLGMRPVLDRAAVAYALGAPPDVVEVQRVKRDMGNEHGVDPEPRDGVASEVVEGMGMGARPARELPPAPSPPAGG